MAQTLELAPGEGGVRKFVLGDDGEGGAHRRRCARAEGELRLDSGHRLGNASLAGYRDGKVRERAGRAAGTGTGFECARADLDAEVGRSERVGSLCVADLFNGE